MLKNGSSKNAQKSILNFELHQNFIVSALHDDQRSEHRNPMTKNAMCKTIAYHPVFHTVQVVSYR